MPNLCRLAITSALLFSTLQALAGPRIESWITPSGARAYYVASRTVPIVDVRVDFPAGAAEDPADKSGLASLTRGLLDAGAADMDEEALAGKLADIGAQLTGATDADRSGISLRTLASVAERDAAVAIMRAVLQKPTFPEAAFEREKGRAIAGIEEESTRPDAIAARAFAAALYSGHPYGRLPTVGSLSAITRDDLLRFHAGHYGAAQASVSIVGDLSRAEAEAIAARLTDALPTGGAPQPIAPPALPEARSQRIAHPAQQAHIYLGTLGLKRVDPDYFPLLVGNHVLGGGGFVSRLTKEVREKRGFAYSVYSYFLPRQVTGPFQIGLQTKRDQADAAMKVVNDTLRAFLRDGPTAEEIKRAKQNIADGFGLRIDSNRKVLENVAVIAFYGLPLTFLDDYPKAVQAVTAAQVRDAFARRLHADRMVTVVVAGGAS